MSKKKSNVGTVIVVIFVLFQIIVGISMLTDSPDETSLLDNNGISDKNIDFPDYPDIGSSSDSDNNSSYDSNIGNSSYDSDSSSDNNYNNNNNSNSTNTSAYSGYLYSQLSDDGKMVYRTVVETLKKGSLNCEFTGIDNSKAFIKEMDLAITAVTYERPEIFWISGSYRYQYTNKTSNNTVSLKLDCFDYWKYTSNPQKYINDLQSAVKKIANQARAYETDFERVVFVHDYIVKNVTYSLKAAEEINNTVRSAATEQSNSAYGSLVTGNAICGGYSKGFQMVLQELGIECIYLTGYAGEYHAWNCVKLDGEYYYVDTTWDDPVYNKQNTNPYPNGIIYSYLNINLQQLSKDHTVLENFKFPDCYATKNNYYRKMGYYFDNYDSSSVIAAYNKQRATGQQILSIQFGSASELNSAKSDLIDGYKWKNISDLGSKTVSYIVDTHDNTLKLYIK